MPTSIISPCKNVPRFRIATVLCRRRAFQVAETYQQLGKLLLNEGLYNDAEFYYNQALAVYGNDGSAEIDYAHAMLGLGEVALARRDYKNRFSCTKG